MATDFDPQNLTGENSGQPSSRRLNVFISYRLEPDADLAIAIKRLIETSIEPSPQVFVASAGGVRPSRLPFKQQLQQAAHGAHAFVALITDASKDREWIFFEAGAAWGRDLMYVPVLIGPRPEDLPSTIGDYQALRGDVRDDMKQLIDSLADLAGATPKTRFGGRLRSFLDSINNYKEGVREGDDDDRNGDEAMPELERAKRLYTTGKTDEAHALFEKLASEANSQNDKCRIRLTQLRTSDERAEWRDLIDKLDASLKETSLCQVLLSSETDRPASKQEHLKAAVRAASNDIWEQEAKLQLADLELRLGDRESSIESLLALVEQKDAPRIAALAANSLVSQLQELTAIEKLFLLLASLWTKKGDGFTRVAKLADDLRWKALRLSCARRADVLAKSETSANDLGMALHDYEFASLAYEAYMRAASLGASVGRVNAASLLCGAANAAAARAILDEHAGSFDSADPSFPCSVRRTAEAAVYEESNRFAEIVKAGDAQFDALWWLADRALSCRATQFKPVGRLAFASGTFIYGNSVSFEAAGDATISETAELPLFGSNLRIATIGEAKVVALTRESNAVGVEFTDFSAAENLRWGRWAQDTSADSALTFPTDFS